MSTLQKTLQTGLTLLCCLALSACQSAHAPKTACTLTLSTWGSTQEIAVLKPLLAKFQATHPTCPVRLLHIPENYFQKLHILIAGDLAPDVMLVNSINAPIYGRHGLLKDLTADVTPGQFYPNAIQALSYQKTLMALPRDLSNLVIFYNRDLLKKAGIPDPTADWTWNDLLRLSQKLTVDANHDGRPKQFGMSFYAKPPLFWQPFVWSAGGDLFSASLSQPALQEQATQNGLSFYADLRNKHHVAPRQSDSGGASMSQLFLQQQVAFLVSGRWSVPVFREQAKFDWDVVPFPIGPSGKSRVGIDASGYAVSAKSAHPTEALALAKFLTSKDAIAAFTKDGLIVPARSEVAESALFLNPDQKPAHSRYFLDIIADGLPTHLPERWNEIAEELQLGLQPVWDGQKSVTEVTPGLTEKLTPLLQTGGPR